MHFCPRCVLLGRAGGTCGGEGAGLLVRGRAAFVRALKPFVVLGRAPSAPADALRAFQMLPGFL